MSRVNEINKAGKVSVRELQTRLSAFELYSIFRDEPYSFFLDSGMNPEKLGRYSFIGANPFLIFRSKNGGIEIIEGEKTYNMEGNPFEELRSLLGKYSIRNDTELPFAGGAVGYLGYDLCHHLEELPRTAVDDVDIQDCFFGFYDGIIAVDHLKKKTYLAAAGINEPVDTVIADLGQRIRAAEEKGVVIEPNVDKTHKIEFKSNFEKEQYLNTLVRLREYIKAGDIYQANLTQRFECTVYKTPFEIYTNLRRVNPAPFAAFMDFGEGHILSSSPERFIRIRDRKIETRPIKGTRPRGKNPEEDRVNREELLSSEKDKAELLMIVDLERNDIGRISKPGSVKVTELFHLEEYPTVYHLVSTITGELRDDSDELDCIAATFPGGSITGAPKIRAMEIIDELEPTQRNVYTGSIGYIGFDGTVDLNIVIRTIVLKGSKAYFQVGGGIVWDSEPEAEYEETLHKGAALMRALRE